VVSLTSSSGGYINGRNSANLELLIDKTSSIYLYVKLKTPKLLQKDALILLQKMHKNCNRKYTKIATEKGTKISTENGTKISIENALTLLQKKHKKKYFTKQH
jgi:hypothetical protein